MLRSLREHAERTGQRWSGIIPPDGQEFKWAHRIAAMVHGWTLHEHNYAQHPVMLSDEDYDTAIALATAGSVQPHEPAVAKAPAPVPVPAEPLETETISGPHDFGFQEPTATEETDDDETEVV